MEKFIITKSDFQFQVVHHGSLIPKYKVFGVVTNIKQDMGLGSLVDLTKMQLLAQKWEKMDTNARFCINYFVSKCKVVGSVSVAMVTLILKI